MVLLIHLNLYAIFRENRNRSMGTPSYGVGRAYFTVNYQALIHSLKAII